jgi:hypothetical protein
MEERDRLAGQLEAAMKREADTANLEDLVQKAAARFRDLRTGLVEGKPESVRKVLQALVDKAELHFDHRQRGKYIRSTFREGRIHVRPQPQLDLSSMLGTAENRAA